MPAERGRRGDRFSKKCFGGGGIARSIMCVDAVARAQSREALGGVGGARRALIRIFGLGKEKG